MITKKDIVQMAHKLVRKSSGISNPKLIHPGREWVIGLGIAILLFALGASFAGYEFFIISKSSEALISVDGTIVEYKQETIQNALTTYAERTKKFESLRADRSNWIPSVVEIEETETESEESEDEETLAEPPEAE